MMKRTLTAVSAGLLAVVMMLGLAACGGDSAKVSRGTWEGSTYKNESIKLTFNMPADWTALTDAQIAQNMQAGSEIMVEQGAEIDPDTLTVTTLNDMMVMAPQTASGSSNVQILIENLAMYQGGTSLSLDNYLDLMTEQLETYLAAYGLETGDRGTKTISGETYTSANFKITATGTDQYLYARKQGNFIVCIIISLFDDMDVNTVLGYFS